jgi:hypothetical protein
VWVVLGHGRFSRDASAGVRQKFRLRLPGGGARGVLGNARATQAVTRGQPGPPGSRAISSPSTVTTGTACR